MERGEHRYLYRLDEEIKRAGSHFGETNPAQKTLIKRVYCQIKDSRTYDYPLMRLRAKEGLWFACERIEAAACCRIWLETSFEDSAATSTFLTRASAACWFSIEMDRLLTVASNRLINAPRVARLLVMVPIAVSSLLRVA